MQNVRVASGTTQLDNCSVDKLLSFDILVPDPRLQRKIASILSAYDDLIENNTRRIAILEEMAQAIYREWFVNFRFPGHENVKLVDSPLGQIPEGWEVKPAREVADIRYGKNLPKTMILSEAEYPVYGAERRYSGSIHCDLRGTNCVCDLSRQRPSENDLADEADCFRYQQFTDGYTIKCEHGTCSFGFVKNCFQSTLKRLPGSFRDRHNLRLRLTECSTVSLLVPTERLLLRSFARLTSTC